MPKIGRFVLAGCTSTSIVVGGFDVLLESPAESNSG